MAPAWVALTNFGDAAVTLPMACGVALWTGSAERKLALEWALLLGCAGLLVGLTKVLYAGCGVQIEALHFRVISGHTMLAAAIWTVLGAELARCIRLAFVPFGALCGLLFASAIGVSRLALDAHTGPEVLIGWLLGSAVALLFLSSVNRVVVRRRHPVLVGVAALAVFVAMFAYGRQAPFQSIIDQYSPWLCRGFL